MGVSNYLNLIIEKMKLYLTAVYMPFLNVSIV